MDSLKQTRLIVLVDNFGLNFSGGSSATVYIVAELKKYFKEIFVICQKLGSHQIEDLNFKYYDNFSELSDLLQSCKTDYVMGYGDFYIAKYFINQGIPFCFTYHDNWPEMAQFEEPLFSEQRTRDYTSIFAAAEHTFSVSEAKFSFISQFTSKYSLVRNGLTQPVLKDAIATYKQGETFRILMAGNIDERKYLKCLDLFHCIDAANHKNMAVDIFGNVSNVELSKKLQSFDFVNLKGFEEQLNFSKYHLLLNTSLMENLSLSVVDALANNTAVVSFDVGGVSEVIDGRNGKLIPAFDVPAMYEAIVNFINNESIEIDSDGIRAEFNWSKSARKMATVMAAQTGQKEQS